MTAPDSSFRRNAQKVPGLGYQLTPLGSGLLEAIGPLVAWTRAHRDDGAAAQAVYDAESHNSITPARPSLPR